MANDSESDEENLSPIFGFSYDDEGNPESRWKIDPQLQRSESLEAISVPDVKGTPSLGFSTASGKPIKVKEAAVEEAKKKLDLGDSVKNVILDPLHNGGPELKGMPSIGFTTATGKPIKVKEAALEDAKKKFDWGGCITNDVFDPHPHSSSELQGMPSSGFSTASGKPIKVKAAALEEAKKKFDWGSNVKNDEFDPPPPNSPNFQRMPSIGFSTASGKPIKVKEAAVEEAKKKFDWGGIVKNDVLDPLPPSNPELQRMPSMGFSTASGKPIKVKEAALEEAKKKFDWGGSVKNDGFDPLPPSSPELKGIPSMGFSTASGKPIKVKEAAVEEAKKKFDWVGSVKNDVLDPVPPASPELQRMPSMGFSTASGKPIKVKEAAVEEARKKFDWGGNVKNDEFDPLPPSNPELKGMPSMGFSTASGKPIKVKEAAVEEAKKKFDWGGSVKNDVLDPLPPGSPELQRMPSMGFSTASGKPIKVKEAAVEEAKKKFDWGGGVKNDVLDPLPSSSPELQRMPSIGFSTASGKPLKVKEAAVEEAKKMFDWGGSKNSDGISSPKDDETMEVEIEPPLLNVTSTSDVFDFVQADPKSPEDTDTVDELTISLLHDVSTNDDDYLWANDETVAACTPPSLSSIQSNGELVPSLKLVVVRVYPVVFCVKSAGTNLFLSEKAYLHQQAAKENKKETLRETLLPEIEEKVRSEVFSKKFSKISKDALDEMDADDLVLYLSSTEDGLDLINQLSVKKRTEVENARVTVEDKIRKEVEEKFSEQLKSLDLETLASPVLKLRVIDALPYRKELSKYRIGVLSVWNPNEDTRNAIQENHMFEFSSLKPSSFQPDHEVRLSTTKGTTIHPTETHPLENGFRRKISTIQEILSGDFHPHLGEFDTVGKIVEISPYTTSSGQMIHLSDQWENILKVKFWSSLKDSGLDDQLKLGEIIACINLQWRKSSSKNGIAYAQEVSYFQTNTKLEHLLEEYQNICLAIKDVDDYTSSGESKGQRPAQEACRVSEPKQKIVAVPEEPQTRSSIKRRYLEQQYGEPPDLPVLHIPAKRGRTNKFVAPRRVERKSN